MSCQRFELLFNELKDEHNREVNQLREELDEYKLKVKHLESLLKSLNSKASNLALNQTTIATQTEDNGRGNDCQSFEQSSDVLMSRRAGRRPTRKATRKLIVNHFEPDYCLPVDNISLLKDMEPEVNTSKALKKKDGSSHSNYNKFEDNCDSNGITGRKRAPVWQHFQDMGQSVNEQFRRAKCLFCDQELHTSKAYLMVNHLAANCDLCPKDISNEYLDKLETNLKSKKSTKSDKMVNKSNSLSVRRRAQIWLHFEDSGPSEFGSYRKAKCVYCKTLFRTSKLPQMSRHLAKECALCPQEVIFEFRNMLSVGETSKDSNFEQFIADDSIVEENKSSRKRTKVWQHFKDLGKGKSGSFRRAECLYCNELFTTSRLSAMIRHLAKNCVLCTKQIKNEYQFEYYKYNSKQFDHSFKYINEDNSLLDSDRSSLLE